MKIKFRSPISVEPESRLIVDYINVKKPSTLADTKKKIANNIAAKLEKAARRLRDE